MSAPTYVEYGGFTNGPGPWVADHAVVYAFVLQADHSALAALVTSVLTTPSAGATEYHALGSHVVVTFGQMDVRSSQPPFDQRGYVAELHTAIWAFTLGWAAGGLPHLAAFIPAIFVSNPLSLTGGREVIGYNKNFGWVGLPDPATLDVFSLDAFGGDYSPTTQAARFPLLSFSRVATGPPAQPEALGGLDAALELVQPTLFGDAVDPSLGGSLDDAAFGELFGASLRQVFLRQFRSPTAGLGASQQQIVETVTSFPNPSVELLNEPFDFTIQQVDSHPLMTETGLAAQQVPFALRITVGFTQDMGTIVWEA